MCALWKCSSLIFHFQRTFLVPLVNKAFVKIYQGSLKLGIFEILMYSPKLNHSLTIEYLLPGIFLTISLWSTKFFWLSTSISSHTLIVSSAWYFLYSNLFVHLHIYTIHNEIGSWLFSKKQWYFSNHKTSNTQKQFHLWITYLRKLREITRT